MSQSDPRPWRELYRPGLDESAVARRSSLVEAWRERIQDRLEPLIRRREES